MALSILETEAVKAVHKAASRIVSFIDSKTKKPTIDWEQRKWEIYSRMAASGEYANEASDLYRHASTIVDNYRKELEKEK